MSGNDERDDIPGKQPIHGEQADSTPISNGRFAKGTSGNPKGRPKKQKKVATALDRPSLHAFADAAYRPVKPLIDGEPTPMTMLEALHQRRFAVAMKGENRLLMRELIEDGKAYEQTLMEASVRNYVKYETLKREGEAALSAAATAGLPAPILLPHPDDIILDAERIEYEVIGPETDAQLAMQRYAVMLRDFMVMRWVYQRRFAEQSASRWIAPEMFELIASQFNGFLPARLRWPSASFWAACQPHTKIGIRVFDKLMRSAQYDIEKLIATFGKKAKRVTAHLEPFLKWRSRSQERRIMQRLRDRSRWMASVILSDPRIAEDVKTLLSEADLPRIFAKVPDVMSRLGLVIGPDGQYRMGKPVAVETDG